MRATNIQTVPSRLTFLKIISRALETNCYTNRSRGARGFGKMVEEAFITIIIVLPMY